jgi:hypothetical protein
MVMLRCSPVDRAAVVDPVGEKESILPRGSSLSFPGPYSCCSLECGSFRSHRDCRVPGVCWWASARLLAVMSPTISSLVLVWRLEENQHATCISQLFFPACHGSPNEPKDVGYALGHQGTPNGKVLADAETQGRKRACGNGS